MKTEKLCKNCKYFDIVEWRAESEYWRDRRAACKRFPKDEMKHDSDWCGEFSDKSA